MLNRRRFLTRVAGAWVYIQSMLKARGLQTGAAKAVAGQGDYDYVVVGSGAGGGTVAARLAELGHSVLVLEAGGDPLTLKGGNELNPGNTLPQDYQVPAFHANSSENSAMKWDFFVRHYTDETQQTRDTKWRACAKSDEAQKRDKDESCPASDIVDGIFYPRAGTLGGCTAHNAMIMVYPHNQDWQDIADATGDRSWEPDKMRKYFEKLENCRHRPVDRFFSFLGLNPTRHGFGGWLHTEKALPLNVALQDKDLIETILRGIHTAVLQIGNVGKQFIQALESQGDPNDWRRVKDNAEGICYTPLSTNGHARTGTRERLLGIRNGKLTIQLNCLATQVLFKGDRAYAVEYREGEKLYRAHGEPGPRGVLKTVEARREIILSGGAFNTPQLLMLSGVGPKDQLEALHIPIRKEREGVGKNLQDRYEIGIVHKLKKDWNSLKPATFTAGDEPYKQWQDRRTGVYITNGAALGVIKKSFTSRPLPDLFMFALIGDFRGYVPGYSTLFATEHNRLTWAVLKAHTENPFGDVTLRSKDPLVAPAVNFRFFNDGKNTTAPDLDSVVEGIKNVRALTKELPFIECEDFPGPACDTEEKLRQFVMDNTWGHHASCTCKIGPAADPMAVLDSNFKVHGIKGLRVVDASIFPKIPGFFIVSSIYMAAEKAAAVIHAESPSWVT